MQRPWGVSESEKRLAWLEYMNGEEGLEKNHEKDRNIVYSLFSVIQYRLSHDKAFGVEL